MELKLRQEKPTDYQETEFVTREAFWNQFAPGCCEHYLLHVMRENPAFVPELDVVAECGGRIVGNVAYARGVIKGDNGTEYEVLTLGPLAVLPEYQQMGIGSQLMEYTRNLARDMGFRAIVLCGDPDYYSGKGFVPAETFGIRTAENMYAAFLQVCELSEHALAEAKGRYYEADVYAIDEAAAMEFDRQFPKKETLTGTTGQKRFLEVIEMQRSADDFKTQ